MPPPLVLRLSRRRTTWEKTDPREVAELLFQDPRTGKLDTKLSVYLLDDRSLVTKARAEHSASFFAIAPKPTQSTTELDLTAATDTAPRLSAGTTRFKFTRDVHAELIVSEDQLVAMAARLLAERQARTIDVSMFDVLSYIDERLLEDDAEWTSVVGPLDESAGSWGKAIFTFRRKRATPPA